MKRYALGVDYGTNSCRSVIVDLADGREVATEVFDYPSGEQGILTDDRNPNVARQNPHDYVTGAVATVTGVIKKARKSDRGFRPEWVVGIGVDTTGSTPMPVDRNGTPLGMLPEFDGNLDAMAWLWKDHSGHAEAEEITALAAKMRPAYLAQCGGAYSSEWFWSKILHCKRAARTVFRAAYSYTECCDYIPALLAGDTRPERLKRSVCAAGHKAMYADAWGGLPDKEFLTKLDPDLARLRERLYDRAISADHPAGRLCKEWARRLGLREGIAIAVGAFDAHMGAVGAGIREGVAVKVLGTSTCDMMVMKSGRGVADIPGVCGIVKGSILPGYYGIEAGQSAVGDIFLWFVHQLVPAEYGKTQEERFRNLGKAAAKMEPGESGLLALDWNNGNRCILTDARLSGLLMGQSLHTEAHEIYRALIEATAFGARTIMGRVREYGIPVTEVVNCGGLAVRNPLLMQIYADVIGCDMSVAASEQTCAVGAAIFGAVAAGKAAGGFGTVERAQAAVCGVRETVYRPNARYQRVYGDLYRLYRKLHDAFGTREWSGELNDVMKALMDIREGKRR